MSFVDEGPSIRELYRIDKGERHVDRRSPSQSATSSGSRPASSAPCKDSNLEISRESGTSPTAKGNGESQDLERSTFVSILSPTAYQSQLLSLFLATFHSSNSIHFKPTFSCHGVWLGQLASRTEVPSTLFYAIRATSLSFLGRQVRDDSLVQNSRLIYGKALLKLNKSLQDPTEGLASDTLSATVLLTFYEVLNSTENCSWVRHAGGAAHLIQLRGVARHRTDVDRVLFMTCRYAILLESFQTGKGCFLAAARWRKLSQEIHDSLSNRSAHEDAREELFQETVQHPGYVMDSVAYMASGGKDRSVLQDLIRRGHMHRSNHKAIYNRWIGALREAGQEPREVPSSVDDKVFPVVYQFPGIVITSTFCSYWSFLKILNFALIGLEAKLSAVESSSQVPHERLTPAQILAARNMKFSPESLANVIVSESIALRELDSTALACENIVTGSGHAKNVLPDRTLSRPMSTRYSETPTPVASSLTDYPTMSPCDTAKRRQLYMAENKHSARQVCKSVENVCTTSFMGPLFLIFALRVVGRMLDSRDEKEWICGKLEALGRTWGVAKEE